MTKYIYEFKHKIVMEYLSGQGRYAVSYTHLRAHET